MEQKTVIRNLLSTEEKVQFDAIYIALEAEGLLPAASEFESGNPAFSIDRFSRKELKGNTTVYGFGKLNLEQDWLVLDESVQIQIINLLADLGAPEQLTTPGWHENFATANSTPDKPKYRTFHPEAVSFINKLVNTGKFNRLSSMKSFEVGRSAYSIKALRKLTAYMKEFGVDEDKAKQALYVTEDHNGTDYLEAHSVTGNAVVDVALRQLRLVVNDCIDTLGRHPTEIVVEMSRDIKKGLKERSEIEQRIDDNRKARNKAKEALRGAGCPQTDNNVTRYLLWEMQEHRCPYCSDKGMGITDIVDGSIVNYEHIIPKKLSGVGRQRSELVLSHAACNDAKGDRLPLTAFVGQPDRISAIENMAETLRKKGLRRTASLLLLDSEDEMYADDSVSGFAVSQAHDTSWIAKLALAWLGTLSGNPSVSVTRGQLTARLRYKWGLETVIPELRYEADLPVLSREKEKISKEKFEECRRYWEGNGHRRNSKEDAPLPQIDKRIDHRHHLIDALVIALTSKKLLDDVVTSYRAACEKQDVGLLNGGRKRNLLDKSLLEQAVHLPYLRQQALDLARNCNLTHKPDRYLTGEFFQKGAYRKVEHPDKDDSSALVIRKPLRDLIKDTPQATRTQISYIACDSTRKLVSSQFDAYLRAGKKHKEALQLPYYQEVNGNKVLIKRVRCYRAAGAHKLPGDNAFAVSLETPTTKNGNKEGEFVPLKYLLSSNNAYLRVMDGKTSEVVPLVEAAKYGAVKAGEVRFHKGDHIENTETGKRYLVSSITEGQIRIVPDTETKGFDEVKNMTRGVAKKVGAIKELNKYKILN